MKKKNNKFFIREMLNNLFNRILAGIKCVVRFVRIALEYNSNLKQNNRQRRYFFHFQLLQIENTCKIILYFIFIFCQARTKKWQKQRAR
jgi:hypothetical protein